MLCLLHLKNSPTFLKNTIDYKASFHLTKFSIMLEIQWNRFSMEITQRFEDLIKQGSQGPLKLSSLKSLNIHLPHLKTRESTRKPSEIASFSNSR